MTRTQLDRRDDWRDFAACQYEDPDTFFAEGRSARLQVREAQVVCHGCPVRQQCGEYAIEAGETWGVWGGMSQQQLRKKRRRFRHSSQARSTPAQKRKSPEAAVCGTNSGYRRHVRDKTTICGPCRQAHADADRQLRLTGTSRAAT
jgi:WhiB family redox-sensing transcriptional regulator